MKICLSTKATLLLKKYQHEEKVHLTVENEFCESQCLKSAMKINLQ